MNNLFLFMSLTGSISFILYFIFTNIFKLEPGNRYFLLKITMAFFLLPFPLLTLKIKEMLRWLLQDDFLLTYDFHDIEYINPLKTIYVATDGIVLPVELYPLYLKFLMAILIISLVITAIILLRKYQELKKCLAKAKSITSDYENLFEQTRKEISIQRHISLKQIDVPYSSFTYGLLHPVIVFTPNLSEEEACFVLRHELYHIKSMDFLFHTLCIAVVILHFYNPIAWFLFLELNKVSELCCDTKVLKDATPEIRKRYGLLLLDQVDTQSPPHFLCVRAFASSNKKTIKERILMSQKKPRKKYVTTAIAASITFIVSTSPVLAYNIPNISSFPQSRNDVLYGIDSYMVYDESLFSEDEIYFKNTNIYFIDQDGEITTLPDSNSNTPRKACAHNYKSGKCKLHKKLRNGSCTVSVYNAKRCIKCSHVVYGKHISTTNYDKCPH